MLEKIKHHMKFQEVNNRLLSLESFCLSQDITIKDLEEYPYELAYLKMACKQHLIEKSLMKIYNHNIAVTLLEIDSIEERLSELEQN